MIEHTPGPWTFDLFEDKSPSEFSVRNEHGLAVAFVPAIEWAEWVANARLIAAAPDLLAACEMALDELIPLTVRVAFPLTSSPPEVEAAAECVRAIQRELRAAIAKARGETVPA